MKKRIIPTVLDLIFVFSAGFIACFTVLRFYLKNLLASILIAFVIANLLTALFVFVSKRKSATYLLKAEDQNKMERTLNALCLMNDAELTTFFKKLLTKMEVPFECEGDIITLKNTNAEIRYYFSFTKSHEGKIIDFYKQTGEGKNLLVIGREFSGEVTTLTSRFGGRIKLLDGANLYLTMKRFEIFPEIKHELKTEKQRINLPRAMLSKKRAKQYFLYGLSLEFFAFFVFFPAYYVCFGAFLIIMSVVCFFFGIKDEPEMQNPFR